MPHDAFIGWQIIFTLLGVLALCALEGWKIVFGDVSLIAAAVICLPNMAWVVFGFWAVNHSNSNKGGVLWPGQQS